MKRLLAFLLFLPLSGVVAQEIEHRHSQFFALTENKGQWAEDVLFQSRSQGQNIWVQQHGFLYDLRDYSKLNRAHAGTALAGEDLHTFPSDLIYAEFAGSQKVTAITRQSPASYYYNYFLGSDSTRWASNVQSFQEVTMANLYPDIDLKIFDHDTEFKYELWCRPGSDLSQIAIDYSGAGAIVTDEKGNLVISTSIGKIIEKMPVAYQIYNGKITSLSCSFKVTGSRVTFELGAHHPNATVVIDPVLIFATYSGAPSDNFGMTATYGYDGTAYSGGTLFGASYPTPDNGVVDATYNFSLTTYGNTASDVYITKYNADGTTMLWTSFLGGTTAGGGSETVQSLICDQQNNLYAYGTTSSQDFPVALNAFQSTHGGGDTINIEYNGALFGNIGTDIFVSKLSANGHNLLGSTFVGGSENDGVNYNTFGGLYNAGFLYDSLTTNYGDQFRGEIMLDAQGNCIVASCTHSPDFPLPPGSVDTLKGKQDGVLFKLNSNLSSLVWSRCYGGSLNDACYSVKIDSSLNIVFSGGTSSSDLPGTAGAYQSSYQGGKVDGFVGKLTPNGQTLIRSSYIGTNNYDQAFFVEINRNDEVFLYGQSRGGTFPIINATGNPNSGQFIIKLTPDLSTVLNSTVFGNGSFNINISPSAFLVDICGNMYVSGWGGSVLPGAAAINGMPVTPDALYGTPPNGFDFYLAVFDRDFDGQIYGTYLGGNNSKEHVDGGTSRFDKNGVVYQCVCGGCGGFSDFPTTTNAWSNQNLSSNCNNVVFKFDFQLIPDAEFFTDDLLGCEDFVVQLENTSTPSDSYIWNFGNGDTSTIIFNPVVTYDTPGNYQISLFVTDSICQLTDSSFLFVTVTPQVTLAAFNDTIICVPSPMTFTAAALGTADTFIFSSTPDFSDTLNTSIADSVFTVTPGSTTTYYVYAGNAGCSVTGSFTVYVVEGALSVAGNNSICFGTPTTLTASAVPIPGLTFDYSWSPVSVITPTAQDNVVTANPPDDTWIVVTAATSNGCFDKDSILVSVGNVTGTVSATANPGTVVPGGTSTLTALPSGYSYTWVPPTGLSNPTGQTTQATVDETTVYTVIITDGICSRSESVILKVYEIACDERYVYVPNAFSPNGDGENEVLFVRSAVTKEIEFRIFDRWGELIFESANVADGWDGTFRDKPVDPDVYDFYLRAVCIDGEEEIIKGNITLIR